MKEVYVLLADGDGTMRSTEEPFGVAVTTEAEAKRFVIEGKVGYSHSYAKLTIFENKDEAIEFSRQSRMTWRDGVEQLIKQKEVKVYNRDLLNSICKELNKKHIGYRLFNTDSDWTIKICDHNYLHKSDYSGMKCSLCGDEIPSF
jgi:hypothetical protein